ncbi:hypothetical protein C8R44DRAFT_882567 [Mycena epipterygia]|nr:hypothetical protein C8R44DRAFT_882567 [Mycena epipterygia]
MDLPSNSSNSTHGATGKEGREWRRQGSQKILGPRLSAIELGSLMRFDDGVLLGFLESRIPPNFAALAAAADPTRTFNPDPTRPFNHARKPLLGAIVDVGPRGSSEFDAGVGPTRAFDLADDDGSSLLVPRSFIIDANARDSGFYDNDARESRSSAADLAYPPPFTLSSMCPHPVYADSRSLYTETPTPDKDKMGNANLTQHAGSAHGSSPALPLPPPVFPALALSITPPPAFPVPPSAFSAAPAPADKSESPFHADLHALPSHSRPLDPWVEARIGELGRMEGLVFHRGGRVIITNDE